MQSVKVKARIHSLDGEMDEVTVVEKREGREVTLSNARRLWFWSGADSCSQLAVDGVKNPRDCKFTVPVEEIVLLDAIEIIPCTSAAEGNLKAVPVWKA